MPGPLLTVTIAQTARRGFRASALLIAGHSLLELALVVGLWFGLGYFAGILRDNRRWLTLKLTQTIIRYAEALNRGAFADALSGYVVLFIPVAVLEGDA